MKKHCSLILFLILSCLLLLCVFSACSGGGDVGTEGLSFALNDDGESYTLIDIGTAAGDIVVPSYYKGKPVTAVGEMAFDCCETVTSLTFAKDSRLTEIGEGAFNCCMEMTAVTLPASLRTIGDSAFAYCALTEIELPSGVTFIGERAFVGMADDAYTILDNARYVGCKGNPYFYLAELDDGATALELPKRTRFVNVALSHGSLSNITVESGNPIYHSMDNCLIETASKTLVMGCQSSRIPTDGSVTRIGDYAFYECSGLTAISLSSSITSVGAFAFQGLPEEAFLLDQGGKYLGNAADPHLYLADVAGDALSISTFTIHAGTRIIGSRAFFGCDALTAITIPASVEYIGESAFEGCEGLKAVSFAAGSRLTEIGNGGFFACDSLTSVYIPAGVTRIGRRAFGNCLQLQAVSFASGSQLTVIDEDAFAHCPVLTSVPLPEGVTTIGEGAFVSCKQLSASFCIPRSVTSIGRYAFSGCDQLKDLRLSENLTFVGRGAFEGFESITVASGNPVYHSADNCLIRTASKLLVLGSKSGVIPADGSVTTIGYHAFYGCDGLTAVSIPAAVTCIDTGSFLYCEDIVSITVARGNPVYHSADNCLIETASKTLVMGCQSSRIPTDGSVTRIGERAFFCCGKLTAINIPEGVISIGVGAFYACDALISIVIPESVTDIGSASFALCYSMESMTLPRSVSLDYLFMVQNSEGYDIPDTLRSVTVTGGTTVVDSAFSGCRGLKEVRLPAAVTEIGNFAFAGCEQLEALDLPDGVLSIGDRAFLGCCQLKEINIPLGVTEIGEYAFAYCTELDEIIIPVGVTKIGEYAFSDCESLTTVTIPASVTVIGKNAFEYCLVDAVIFEVPQGWSVEGVPLSAETLADPAAAAELLTRTKYSQAWWRN